MLLIAAFVIFIKMFLMCVQDYTHDIVRGFFSGIFGGSGVFLAKLAYDQYSLWKDKRDIYSFMLEQQKSVKKWNWRTTVAISAATKLSEERVRQICTKHDKITRNSLENEVWSLK